MEEKRQGKASSIGTRKGWTSTLLKIRTPFKRALLAIAGHAARHPKSYIVSIIVTSIAIVAIGLFTNFTADVDEDALWTPNGRALSHRDWIAKKSGFPLKTRWFVMSIHGQGNNIFAFDDDSNHQASFAGDVVFLTNSNSSSTTSIPSKLREGVKRIFEALDVVRTIDGFDKVCQQTVTRQAQFVEGGNKTCPIISPTSFWNHSFEVFNQFANQSDGGQILQTLSKMKYPNGQPVDERAIYGNLERNEDGILTFAQTYTILVGLPPVEDAKTFETRAIQAILNRAEEWTEQGSSFRLEVFTQRSVGDEFTRAIVKDIPLIPIAFAIMAVFTSAFFLRPDWVRSRTLLGVGAVVCVLLSIMTGYGILFICGVPLTPMTQILPFVMFGIGLDDAFIIMGAFRRTEKDKEVVDRIHDTIEEVGFSILVTTITSVVAFGLGCTSTIPAVYWLCLYAFPTIFIDFVYQITFFVALIVLDENRVRENRRDWFVCLRVKNNDTADETQKEAPQDEKEDEDNSLIDKFMIPYSNFLMRPWVKVIVLVAYSGLSAACIYSVSRLEQAFDVTDVLPSDSYVSSFFDASNAYTGGSIVTPKVYFRNVDQSDGQVQDEMEEYVNQLVALPQISRQPPFFWLRDFLNFTATTNATFFLPFPQQMDAFLANPMYHDLYINDIVRDANTGHVLESRLSIRMDNIDVNNVESQVNALSAQRRLSAGVRVNQQRQDEWAFFTYNNVYLVWEFYTASPRELATTTILGVFSVTVIGMVSIPHWTAVFFVLPLISILYVDLMGVLQFATIHINPVSFISITMGIGLLIDYIIHVLLRYFESTETTREGRVKDTLRSIGSSVLVGGISTFLGVIPLSISTSNIFNTLFVTFMGLVGLGIGHGLMLLPVLLSIIGPEPITAPVTNGTSENTTADSEDKC